MRMECSQCGWKPDSALYRHCRVCGSEVVPVPSDPLPTASGQNAATPSTSNWLESFEEELQRVFADIFAAQTPSRVVRAQDVERISRLVVDDRRVLLVDSYLEIGTLKLPIILASFSSIPESHQSITGSLVQGVPVHGEKDLQNDCRGKILVLQRGKVSFAQKYLAARQSGAAALLVAQSSDGRWPFFMTDNSQELAQVGESALAQFPVAMISARDMERLEEMLSSRAEILASVVLRIGESCECSICKDDFAASQEIIKLDCRHSYHAGCLESWLQRNSTCPMCRQSVLASKPV